MEREEKRITGSGIEIYSYANPSLNGFYISLFLRAGSMYESERDSGITHFLEHVAIRNVNTLMDGRLYPTLDKYGIEFNASTYSEMVQFYVSGASANFTVGAELLTKILSPIVLSPSEIKTECSRIKAEIREGDDRTSLSSFTAKIVHEGTTLARPITGTVGGVSKITRARLEEYRRRTFTKENVFFYVTGDFSDTDLDALADFVDGCELFSGEPHTNVAPVPEKFGRRDGKLAVKSGDFTMVRFTFDIDMAKVSVPESDLLYDILLSGYNSRFFIEMSERRGLFYDLSGATERYKNIGTLTFSYEVKPETLCEAVELTLSILEDMKKTPIPEDECMKAGYVANSMMLYDDLRELNFTFAYDNHIMSNGYSSLDERAAAYEKVTPEDILRASREIFRRENLTVTIKGNKNKIDTGKLEELIAKFGKNGDF